MIASGRIGFNCRLLHRFVDINECEYHLCNQRCMNYGGGYRCLCDQGYILAKDHKTCHGKGTCTRVSTFNVLLRVVSTV